MLKLEITLPAFPVPVPAMLPPSDGLRNRPVVFRMLPRDLPIPLLLNAVTTPERDTRTGASYSGKFLPW